jgi:hypothetical protein
MSNNVIGFSTNWNNKLNNESFTTLRLNSDKFEVGKTYKVVFKGHLKDVLVIDKKILLLENISEWIALIDTGHSRQECINIIKRMYSKYDIDWTTKKLQLLLLKTVK